MYNPIAIAWVPEHSDLEVNKATDTLAKLASRFSRSQHGIPFPNLTCKAITCYAKRPLSISRTQIIICLNEKCGQLIEGHFMVIGKE